MAYAGLTIESYVGEDATFSSHCIPAYPEYYSDTVFDAAFYTLREDQNDKLAGGTIQYHVPS